MKPRVTVKLDNQGHPVAELLPQWNWMADLVDYLSFNHLSVAYDLDQNWFRVTFLRQTPADAQNLLNQWTESQLEDCSDMPRSFCQKECKHVFDCPHKSRRTSVC
jgi:hypothetical protein